MYTDKHGTRIKQKYKIRFLYDIKDSKNIQAFKKGDIGVLINICGVDMLAKQNYDTKKYYFSMPLNNVQFNKVEVVR